MTKSKHKIFLLALIAAWCLGALSCNKKEEATEENYLASESVAISSFSLSPDLRVMNNLDSVFFSIDLDHGVVFNADSLPKGTKIGALIPVITFPASVTSAIIEMKGGSHRKDGTVNYKTNPTDTIDFTGEVTLTLGNSDGSITKTYRLKVNVHQEDPDVFYWDGIGNSALPSRLGSPTQQKSVEYGSGALTLLEENDGTYTVAVCSDLFEGKWDKRQANPGFTPDVRNLTSIADTLYILDDAGNLYSSVDGISWTLLASDWDNIIGSYNGALMGIRDGGGNRVYTFWPQDAVAEGELPAEFPVNGYSAPVEFTSRWSGESTIVIFGGEMADGSLSSASWAFDGSQWADISNSPLPALTGVSIVKYYSYLSGEKNSKLKEFEVLLAMGGKLASGYISNDVYITYDFGINWTKAPSYMQLPSGLVAGMNADSMTRDTTLQSDLSNLWKAAPNPRKVKYELSGDYILWECPYIFLFGGQKAGGALQDNVRCGVLRRLTFTPLF